MVPVALICRFGQLDNAKSQSRARARRVQVETAFETKGTRTAHEGIQACENTSEKEPFKFAFFVRRAHSNPDALTSRVVQMLVGSSQRAAMQRIDDEGG